VSNLQDSDVDRADALLTLADLSYRDGDDSSGLDELKMAEEAVRNSGDQRLLAKLNSLLARRAHDERSFEDAIKLYEDAIGKGQGLLTNSEIGDMQVGLGTNLEQGGQVAEALEAYRAGSVMFERDDDSAKLADALDLQAHAELELGRPAIAAALYDRAADMFETVARFGSAVDAYLSLAKIQDSVGKKDEARTAQNRALALTGRLSDKDEVDEIYQMLGAPNGEAAAKKGGTDEEGHSARVTHGERSES
jgi:tetratricopeptide (TPR) repeat protein